MTEQTKLVKQCACTLYLAYHAFVESRQPCGGHSSHFSYQATELCSSGRNLAGGSVLEGTSVFSLLPSLSVSFYLCLVISTGLYILFLSAYPQMWPLCQDHGWVASFARYPLLRCSPWFIRKGCGA